MRSSVGTARSQAGFTLVELMIAVGILGIIASIASTNYRQFVENARNGRRMAEMTGMASMLRAHYGLEERYPATVGWISSEPGDSVPFQADYIPGFANLPRDMQTGQPTHAACGAWKKAYLYMSDGQNYKLLSHCASDSYRTLIDPIRDGNFSGSGNDPTACTLGDGGGAPAWAMSIYSSGARCW